MEKPRDDSFQQQLDDIESMIRELNSLNNLAARKTATRLVQALLDLHGAGLERILELVHQSASSGQAIIDRLGEDEVIGPLLILHDLHPLDLQTRVRRALEKVGGRLKSKGVQLELLGFQAGIITIRVKVAEGFRSSTRKLQEVLEEAILEAAPDVVAVQLEGLSEEPGFVPLAKLVGG